MFNTFKSFGHPISCRMIRGCPVLISVGCWAELLNNFTLKSTALVWMEARWKTVMTDKVIKEQSGSSFSCLVSCWGSQSEACKMVCDYHQNMFMRSWCVSRAFVGKTIYDAIISGTTWCDNELLVDVLLQAMDGRTTNYGTTMKWF